MRCHTLPSSARIQQQQQHALLYVAHITERGFARSRKACWRIFAARRKQALRGSRVRPLGLCLNVAHPRYRGSRAFPRRRGLAGHALMPTRGGRPSGARAISRPFLRKFLNFFQPNNPNNSMRAWVGHLFKSGKGYNPSEPSSAIDPNIRSALWRAISNRFKIHILFWRAYA